MVKGLVEPRADTKLIQLQFLVLFNWASVQCLEHPAKDLLEVGFDCRRVLKHLNEQAKELDIFAQEGKILP